MGSSSNPQAAVRKLNEEYKEYVQTLKTRWISQNRMQSRNVYEVMDPEERAEVDRRLAQWETYITPLAETWWKERGYGVIWPADNSQPMKVYKLET